MKAKKYISLLLTLALFCCTFSGCDTNHNSDSSTSKQNVTTTLPNETFTQKNGITPLSITDLFDGESRVWFYIEKYDLKDGLSYESDIEIAFITENKTVTSFYYNLMDSGQGCSIMESVSCSNSPHPFSYDRFSLGDFAGLSFKDTIEKIQNSYADGSLEYSFNYNFYPGVSGDFSIEKHKYPYTIKYNGALDSSGNKLKNEQLSFSDGGFWVKVGKGNYDYSESVSCETFYIDSVIQPTIIKDKSYVGLKDYEGNMIITENTYASFNDIKFDNPNGITEW